MEYVLLSAEKNVDTEAQCLFRHVYGYTDKFYPHYHDFYEIFLTVKGTVTHHINGIEERLPEGSLVFIRPEDRHAYCYGNDESRHTEFVNLTFTRQTAEALFAYLSDGCPREELLSRPMPPTVLLSREEMQSLVARIGELNCADWEDKRALKLHMRVILVEVFSRYFARDLPHRQEALPGWLSHLLSQMSLPENFILGSERMFSLSGRTREHVARSVKRYCGVTVSEFINQKRINYASNLLLHSNVPVSAVCYECGFESMSYFYRVFRRCHRMSPQAFRATYGEAN